MSQAKQEEGLKAVFSEITKTKIDSLVSEPEWGSITFEGSRKDLERVFGICNHFKLLPLELLPEDIASAIINHGNGVNAVIEKIRGFTIEQDNPSAARNNIAVELKKNVDAFYKTAHIYVPYLAYQKGEIQENIRNLTKSVSDARENFDSAREYADKKKIEIDKIVSSAKEASASVGVGHFTSDFNGEAEYLEGAASKWLTATVLLAALTFLFGIYFLNSDPDLDTVAKSIQYISSKILILVLLITATLWCGNLYKATKHQSSANKFKSNALKTFQAFVNATDDVAVRDAVLIETTRAIFSESATGYIGGEGGGTEKSTKIVEVVKNGAQAASAASRSG
ncbi:hypothetical protein Y5S_02591 [Alcanivorax nanhaiticus]|uniref:Uncharacterized protein n=1 Tax=Alcanivorax nanhaiticus TaxID=1177154 RepID=A0A095SHF7_9GAMM|nr:hypothetical protein [Alcanivorax nanhaiticus]KGD64051.1 hypothetical protein Y5S_02591 [Alcanivorax nanhaiticus]